MLYLIIKVYFSLYYYLALYTLSLTVLYDMFRNVHIFQLQSFH